MPKRRSRPALLPPAVGALLTVGLLVCCAGSPPGPGVTRFRTPDGFTIAAELHLPPGEAAAPLVVLCHQYPRDRRSWDPLVPGLVEHGYAVVAVDHRAFGESRGEVAAPQDLDDFARANLYHDIVGAVAAVSDHPRVDGSRLAVAAAGFSVTPAVHAAREEPRIAALVLLSGYIGAEEEEFLIAHPELPVLLAVASGDRRMAAVVRQHAKKLMGENQILFEFAAGNGAAGDAGDAETAGGAANWEGTDGLTDETGLGDFILWFLDEHVPR